MSAFAQYDSFEGDLLSRICGLSLKDRCTSNKCGALTVLCIILLTAVADELETSQSFVLLFNTKFRGLWKKYRIRNIILSNMQV